MNIAFFTALAILGVVIGSLTLAPAANAVYEKSGHGTAWYDDPNG
jgi:hypothetical protein